MPPIPRAPHLAAPGVFICLRVLAARRSRGLEQGRAKLPRKTICANALSSVGVRGRGWSIILYFYCRVAEKVWRGCSAYISILWPSVCDERALRLCAGQRTRPFGGWRAHRIQPAFPACFMGSRVRFLAIPSYPPLLHCPR